jgi:hypothetical protein
MNFVGIFSEWEQMAPGFPFHPLWTIFFPLAKTFSLSPHWNGNQSGHFCHAQVRGTLPLNQPTSANAKSVGDTRGVSKCVHVPLSISRINEAPERQMTLKRVTAPSGTTVKSFLVGPIPGIRLARESTLSRPPNSIPLTFSFSLSSGPATFPKAGCQSHVSATLQRVYGCH